MKKIIPILPCTHIQEQANFYKILGFEIAAIYTNPNAYGVFRYGEIEIHFYGNKKFIPSENPSMCILQVDDIDSICDAFTANIKKAYGKIPRSGIPKITKVRDLKDDRRFTLTDIGGNTVYVCSTDSEGADFRLLENQDYTKEFSVLYDLINSKEDQPVAKNMLSKISHIKDSLNDNDKARFMLIELEILGADMGKEVEKSLKNLINKHSQKDDFWIRVEKKYHIWLQS